MADTPLSRTAGAEPREEDPIPDTAVFCRPPAHAGQLALGGTVQVPPPAERGSNGAQPVAAEPTADTVARGPEPASETAYPSRADIEAVSQRLRNLSDNPQAPQTNGSFAMSGRGWGGKVFVAVHTGEDNQALAGAIEAEREFLREKAAKPELTASLLNVNTLPVAVRQEVAGYGGQAGNLEMLDRLLATDEHGTPKVSDDTFLKVVGAHLDAHLHRQEWFDTNLAAGYRQRFTEAVERAVSSPDGWLPKQALDNLTARLPHFRILVDDGFRTEFMGRSGFAERCNGDYLAYISPSEMPSGEVVDHEMTHGLLGGEHGQKITTWSEIFGGPPFSAHWLLGETVTHYTALSLHNGGPLESYADYLEEPLQTGAMLLETLREGGVRPVDMRHFLEVSVENHPSDPTQGPAADRLRAELAAAFPMRDIISDLASLTPPNLSREEAIGATIEAVSRYNHRLRAHVATYKLRHGLGA